MAVIAGLLMMRVGAASAAAPQVPALSRVTEGFSYVRRTRPVAALLLLIGVVSLVGAPYSVLMPIFADRILHSGARGLGILMGANGFGALVGAVSLAARREIRGLGRWVAAAAAGFGASLILFALARQFW